MKRALKWISAVLLTPVIVVAVFSLLLYFPPFQRLAVGVVTSYASEKTGLDISIESVGLDFPFYLTVDGLKVLQERDSLPNVIDTVAHIDHIVVDMQLLPLLKKQVNIDALDLTGIKLNTTNLIHEARVKGYVGQMSMESHGIDLANDVLRLDKALLSDAKLSVELSDTVPPDTSESENFWKIYVDNLNIRKTDVTIHMPGDTLQVRAYLGDSQARNGFFDLDKGLYKVSTFDWKDGQLQYDNNFEKPSKGLDYNHILLSNLALSVDSVSYCSPKCELNLRSFTCREKSGLNVEHLTGKVFLDSTKVIIPNLDLKTSESTLKAHINMQLNTFDEEYPGVLETTLQGSFGKQDILLLMGDVPAAFRQKWPNQPLSIDGNVRGNMQHAQLNGLKIALSGAFDAVADGVVENITNPDKLKARLDVHAKTQNLDFVTSLLDTELRNTVRIPRGISFDGNVNMDGNKYASNFVLKEGGGSLRGDVKFDSQRMSYNAKLNANAIPLQHFLPNYGLSPLTGTIDISGQGTDIMSPHTNLTAKANIRQFRYNGYSLNNVSANALIRNGRVTASVNSRNQLLNGNINISGLTSSKFIKGTVSFDINNADLHNLGLTDTPMVFGGCAHLDIDTDMKQYYKVQGFMSDIVVVDGDTYYRPDDIVLDVLTQRDTTYAVVDCGDFHLSLNADSGYEGLLASGENVWKEVQRQYEVKTIDQVMLRKQLPNARIFLTTGRDNFIMTMLNRYGIDIGLVNLDMTASPLKGLNGLLHAEHLMIDSILLDTVNLGLVSDSVRTTYQAQVRNNKNNPQYTFNALADGIIYDRGTILGLRLFDDKDKMGIRLGVKASMEEGGYMFRTYGKDPILGYTTFHVNEDNYVFLGTGRRVSADLKLRADDGTGIQIYTDDDNTEALQDVTFSLHHFDLERILSVIPYTPDVSGMMSGDFHVIQTSENLSIASTIDVKNMFYEHSPMGDISTEFVYMPNEDGTHYVDGILSQNGIEVATIIGTYHTDNGGYLEADANLLRLPLSMLNGFVPDQIIGFGGYAEGDVNIKGALDKPVVNGELFLDSAYMESAPYGVKLRFDDDPVTIKNSQLLLENFNMYANNNSPLVLMGNLDFSDLDHMKLSILMRAKNFQIIDAKENPRSEAYGKAFVNFFGSMQGELNNLRMRGRLDVLGSTDMTYILRDSPLTTDNQLDELVQFTNFNDTTQQVATRPPLNGFNMDLTMNIDESAHILCALNVTKSNYIDLIGGGELRLRYDVTDNIRLNGRYTLSNGEMKYSLPVIPLKTFTIQDGSYIEFNGDPMNPRLNITAVERTKASVSSEDGNARLVEFDCGVVITKTLNDMGLEFIIDAPSDMIVSNQLNAMGAEERGKLAVTLLTTGMYLADGNTNAFSMNSTLSAFLNSQINSIAGNALKTLDLSFGLDNSTDASGNLHTDYSFKFSKRLWNNRLRIIIGGKLSSGGDAASQNENFLNNVQLEYRLNQGSTQYLKAFYDRDSYDWLEGDVGEYGVGFIWRRKLQHFKDIFRFKEDKPMMMPVRRDSTRTFGRNPSDSLRVRNDSISRNNP